MIDFTAKLHFFLQPILDLVTEKMPAYDDIIRAMCDQQVDTFSKYMIRVKNIPVNPHNKL